jgi:hypothetical protein
MEIEPPWLGLEPVSELQSLAGSLLCITILLSFQSISVMQCAEFVRSMRNERHALRFGDRPPPGQNPGAKRRNLPQDAILDGSKMVSFFSFRKVAFQAFQIYLVGNRGM